ncbi:hypothetical protein [Thiolapillus sp.]
MTYAIFLAGLVGKIERWVNNCLQLTVKSVTNFATAKFPPLFTSAEAGDNWKVVIAVNARGYCFSAIATV